MPTNTIEIIWSESQGLEAKVWDKDGNQHNIESIFQRIKGATGLGHTSTRIVLGNASLGTTLDFTATSKELKFGVSEHVIDQILEALP